MKRFLLVLICISATPLVMAQKISIKGQVLDSASNTLSYATVMLLSPKDSPPINFGTTNPEGFFEIKNINHAEHLLKITFVGYKTYSAVINPADGKDVVELGAIKMEVALTRLDELVVQAEQAPVVVKHDTIEFNAGSFKTNPNATVEDLLKKLPGI